MTRRCFIGLLIATVAIGQEPDWEKIVDSANEVQDDQPLIDYLQWLQQEPLDINRATAQELQSLPWIEPVLAERIVAFRRQTGSFPSLHRLLLVAGMNEILINQIAPFIRCGQVRPPSPWAGAARMRFSQPGQKSRGYNESKYIGPNSKNLIRLQSHIAGFSHLGLIMERDNGEKEMNDYQGGFLQLQMNHPALTVMLGQWTVESGQGLVFSHPSQWSGDWEVLAPSKRRERPLRPYLATDENAGLEGVAVHWAAKRFNLTTLWSSTNVDATMEEEHIRTFQADGLHRTAAELDSKDQARKNIAGVILNWQAMMRLRLGLSVQKSHLSDPVKRQDRPDNFFAFTGRDNPLAGLNWDATLGTMNWFGEWAWCRRSFAVNSGLWWHWADLQSTLLMEMIPSRFHNLLYPHLSIPQDNQTRFRWALKWQKERSLSLSWMAERVHSPWLRYRLSLAHSTMTRYAILLTWDLHKNLAFTARTRATCTPLSETWTTSEKQTLQVQHRSVLGQVDYQPWPRLALRSRMEWNQTVRQIPLIGPSRTSQGVSSYQQFHLTLKKTATLCGRIMAFQAADFDDSFYEYEPDLPGLMRIKMVYGRGVRWFGLVRLRFFNLQVSAKYEETLYKDRNHIGSGWDEVTGSRERMASCQCEIHW